MCRSAVAAAAAAAATSQLPCEIDRDCATTLLRHRGLAISQQQQQQRIKPIAMVKGNVLHPAPQSTDIIDANDKSISSDNIVYDIGCNQRSRSKGAPEPPIRHCTDPNVQKRNSSLDQLCDTYDSMNLTTVNSVQSHEIYDSYNQMLSMQSMQYYENKDCHLMQQMGQSTQHQQPIYVNYKIVANSKQHHQSSMPLTNMPNPIQTKAEVHVEKPQISTTNDSKVSKKSN